MKHTKNLGTEKNLKGNRKTKYYYLVLISGVALIGWSLFDKGKTDLGLESEGDVFEEVIGEEQALGDENGSAISAVNHLEGMLNNSNDLSRGNLKLVTKVGDIYVRTTRDYSAMIGLQVLAQINGTLDNFELVDIQPKIEKDGFIISQ